jgi:hypothetical protein
VEVLKRIVTFDIMRVRVQVGEVKRFQNCYMNMFFLSITQSLSIDSTTVQMS